MYFIYQETKTLKSQIGSDLLHYQSTTVPLHIEIETLKSLSLSTLHTHPAMAWSLSLSNRLQTALVSTLNFQVFVLLDRCSTEEKWLAFIDWPNCSKPTR